MKRLPLILVAVLFFGCNDLGKTKAPPSPPSPVKVSGGVVSPVNPAWSYGVGATGRISEETNTMTFTDGDNPAGVSLATLAAAAGTDDQTAAEVANTPDGNIAAETVQAALNELDTEKQALLDLGVTLPNYATALTGGAAGALDAIASAGLAEGDIAYVTTISGSTVTWYVYKYDETGAALTESSPTTILPDDGDGTDGWRLMTASNQSLLNTANASFNTLSLNADNALSLGTMSSIAGKIQFKNATNNNIFTITSGVAGAAIGWTTPTAAPGGDNYLLNVDADGTMGYTDPSTLGGSFTGGTLTSELVIDETGIEGQPTDAISDCSSFAATGGGIFYDDSEGKWKKCQDNTLSDLDTNSGGATAFDDIADPDAASSVTFGDNETIEFDTASIDETFFLISLNAADLTADTTALKITAVDNDDPNYIPFIIQDDQDGTPDDLFKVDYQGTVTATAYATNAEDGQHYIEAINTVDVAATATLGRYAFGPVSGDATSRHRIADGTDWNDYLISKEAIDTSAELIAILGDETGTGALTFATAPSFTTSANPVSSDGATLGTTYLEWSDIFFADGAVINLGADQDVTLTHVADTGVLLNGAMQFQFRDSAIYISSVNDGYLDLEADTGIRFNGPVTLANEGAITAGGLILGDSTPDAEGEMGYASNQVSVHDGTASRSLLQIASTVITKSEYLPIRYAEDDDSVTAPAAAAEIGTTTMIGRSFVEDADNGVVFWWHVPLDYSAGVKYRVYYAIQTDAGADETVAFSMAGCSNGNTDAIACSEGTAVVVSDELTTDYDAAELIVSDWSTAVTVTNIAAGEMAKLLFIRDVSEDDYDDADDNTFVVAVEIKYQAKVNATGDY